ncbi:MAG: hypothetical protein DME98_16865 [Verrucomicrobia bacterium]|nr:MAG: hypothetical protein DME98_16865 [Verrucomicrobiota bacterium]
MTTEDVRNELETQTHLKRPAGNLGGALLFLRAPSTFTDSKTHRRLQIFGMCWVLVSAPLPKRTFF